MEGFFSIYRSRENGIIRGIKTRILTADGAIGAQLIKAKFPRILTILAVNNVSFGYPACPNLEDQAKLFGLIKPEDIGVQLTEEYMMDPEASVSAIVFAHPDARYFVVD